MSAAHELARPAAAKPASTTVAHRPVEWSGEALRLLAIPTAAGPARSVPQAVMSLAALSSARARLGVPDLGHGHQRVVAAGMANTAMVGALPWVADRTPTWIAYTTTDHALRALAAGLHRQCIAAGLPTLRGRWRVQPVGVAGRFLDAREGPGRPALFAGASGLRPSCRMAANIAKAGALDGVLAEAGLIAIYRAAAITHRQLGPAFDVVVSADGEATARRIRIEKETAT